MRSFTRVAVAALAVTAAAPQGERPADTIARLEHALSDSSAAADFAAAIGPALDSGFVYLHPGDVIFAGADDVREQLANLTPPLAPLLVEWRAEHVEFAGDGTLAITWGTMTARPRAGGPTRFGRYVGAWRATRAGWRLAALATSGVFAAASFTPEDQPAIDEQDAAPPSRGPAARFVAADRAFATLAARRGAAAAFTRYAASDAVTFAASGLLRRGPAAIGAALAGDNAAWRWRPVIAIASDAGDLGVTVGESEITPRGEARAFYGKYLTAWRLERSGPRFIADIGNARPAPDSSR